MIDWIGYQWLAKTYAIEPIQAFRIDNQISRKLKEQFPQLKNSKLASDIVLAIKAGGALA